MLGLSGCVASCAVGSGALSLVGAETIDSSVGVPWEIVVLPVNASHVLSVWPCGSGNAAGGGEMAVNAAVKVGCCSAAGVSACVGGRSGWLVLSGCVVSFAVGSGTMSLVGAETIGSSVGVPGEIVVLAVKASHVVSVWPCGSGNAASGDKMEVDAAVKVGCCSAAGVTACVGGRSCGGV